MRNRILLGIAIAIIIGTLGAAVAGFATPATAAAARDRPAIVAPSPDPSLVAAVARWVTDGGQDDLNALSDDFRTLEGAANTGDMTRISASCTRLGKDVRTAQEYAPIPDSAAQTSWSAALDSYAQGARDCVAGADASDAKLITRASTEITDGSTELDKVTARLNEISG